MKRLLLILLIPLLALVLISCDQDMRNGLAGFLGTFGGNAFLDSGMIPSDHSNAEATVEHIANLGSGGKSGEVSGGKIDNDVFGFEIDLGSEFEDINSFLLPQNDKEQQELKNNLEDALGSDSEKEALLTELSQPAEGGAAKDAAEGTVALLGALLDALIGDDDDDDGEFGFLKDLLPDLDDDNDTKLTQGDVLMLQLMIDLVGNAVDVIKGVKDGGGEGVEPKDVIPLIDNVLFAAWVAGEIGETTSLNFSGFGNLGDFINQVAGEGGN